MDNNFGGRIDSAVTEERIDLGKLAPLGRPLVLYIEPSGYCNFRCKFCPQGLYQGRLKKENLTLETAKRVVDEVENWGGGKWKKIRITGMGEPLINPKLINILKYIRKRDIADCLELITNGYLLDENYCKELPKYLDIIRISINGLSDEEYCEVTGSKVNFEELVLKISELYSKRGNCKIYIKIHSNAVQTQERAERFFGIFDLISDEIAIENLSDIWPGFKSELCSKNKKFRYSLDGAGFGTSLYKSVCPQIFKSLQIYANGDVGPCCVDWERKLCLGNLKEKRLSDIWNGKELFDLRMQHLELEKDRISVCRECMANNYMEIDNLDYAIQEIKNRMLQGSK